MNQAKPVIAANAWLRWDLIVRHLDEMAGDIRILECGAGRGAVATRLAERGEYWGIEPDPVSRETAERRLAGSGRVVAGLEQVPDEPFDLLCSFEVLEHIEDDRAALADWVRRLRPGAEVLVSVPAHRHRFASADTLVGHLRRYDPDDLRALFADCGLVGIDVRLVGFPLGYVLETGRNLLARRSLSRRVGADPKTQTAGSGRWHQPREWMGKLTEYGTLPSRLVQRAMPHTRLGTGLLGRARVPSS